MGEEVPRVGREGGEFFKKSLTTALTLVGEEAGDGRVQPLLQHWSLLPHPFL